jgi:hypothetical protein
MDVKRLAGAAAIAAGIGLSALPCGVGLVNAAPSDPPPPCLNCQPDPRGPDNGPQDNPPGLPPGNPGVGVPGNAGIEPPVGGGPTSGGRSVQQPG